MTSGGQAENLILSQRLNDALECFSVLIKEFKRRNPGVVADDRERARTLSKMVRSGRADLASWTVNEVLVFAVRSYAEDLMLSVVCRGAPSSFLEELHGLWRPTLRQWVFFLRRYCVLGSFRLFVLVLRTNHCVDMKSSDERSEFARFVLNELPEVEWAELMPANYPRFWSTPSDDQALEHAARPFDENLIESVVASFVRFPHDISRSVQHRDDILALTNYGGPQLVGAACRRLMMFLTRPMQCRCDHVGRDGVDTPRLPFCICKRALEKDRRKEYARVLFFTVFKEMKDWDGADKQTFLMQACASRFSPVVYNELSKHLNGRHLNGNDPPIPQNPELRKFTSQELRDCYHRDDSVVLHAGCAFMNCKQNFSRDCANVMCATHCRRDGTNPCRVSKHNARKPALPHFKCLCCRGLGEDFAPEEAYEI